MNKKVLKISLTAAMTTSMVFATAMVQMPSVGAVESLAGRVFQENGTIVEFGDDGVLIVDGTRDSLSDDLDTQIGDREVYEVSSSQMPGEASYNLGNALVVPVAVTAQAAQDGIKYSDPIAQKIAVEDEVIYVDVANELELTGIETGTQSEPLVLGDNDPTTGASYYNMMSAYSKVFQANPEYLGSFEIADIDLAAIETIYTPTQMVERQYLDDLMVVFDKINTFDQSLALSYDYSMASINLIATNGIATLKFHVQSNGYWGYALGWDSIISQVFDVDGGYMEDMATQTAKGNFFKVDYGNGIYVLRDTDLQNPVLIMNEDEALLIDTDNYGAEVFNDYIKEAIGDRELSVYVTHVHGDHLINLQYLNPEDVATLYYPQGEPTSGPTAGNVMVEDILDPFIDAGKMVKVEDGDKLNVAGKEFEVIAMGGHTVGGTQLLDITDRILFSGDTLGTQTYKGGTRVALSKIDEWQSEIEKNIVRLGVGTDSVRYDYLISGHMPYPVVPEYEEWFLATIMAVKENQMDAVTVAPTGAIVVVKDGVLQTSQQIMDLFENPILDDDATRYASISVTDDLTPVADQETQESVDNTATAKDTTTDETIVETGDNTNPLLAGGAIGASLAILAVLASKKQRQQD